MVTAVDVQNFTDTYNYNGDGMRLRRNIGGQETWLVYGIGGELLAEYASNAAPSSPQKEYGYRNGQLLITASTSEFLWLTPDHLGTPRIILDSSGSFANVKRHDYLPFGEEIAAGVGGRTTQIGYVTDDVRQKFTEKERDGETGLDFSQARYYGSTLGRFTGADTVGGTRYSPQSLNRYSYVGNNPLRFIDPSGHDGQEAGDLPAGQTPQNQQTETIGMSPCYPECALPPGGSPLLNEEVTVTDSITDVPLVTEVQVDTGLLRPIPELSLTAELGDQLTGNDAGMAATALPLLADSGPSGEAVLGAAATGLLAIATWDTLHELIKTLADAIPDSSSPDRPKVPDDPATPPGPGWVWKGQGAPGSSKGAWNQPSTGESLHPDLGHPPPAGPHWDYRDRNKNDWRIFPDGWMEPK